MPVRPNHFKRALAAKVPQIGLWSTVPDLYGRASAWSSVPCSSRSSGFENLREASWPSAARLDLGFSAPGNFSRFFKEHTGVSPSIFKRATRDPSPVTVTGIPRERI